MSIDVEKIVREYIDKSLHMSLGTSKENKPWVCEVHFCYDEDLNLYFVSLPESRHCKEIADNPFVAGNIAKQHDITESPNGIYFEGTAVALETVSDDEVALYCNRLMRDAVELQGRLAQANGHRMYKIEVKNWAAFGKFGGDKNQKYELSWNGGQR